MLSICWDDTGIRSIRVEWKANAIRSSLDGCLNILILVVSEKIGSLKRVG